MSKAIIKINGIKVGIAENVIIPVKLSKEIVDFAEWQSYLVKMMCSAYKTPQDY